MFGRLGLAAAKIRRYLRLPLTLQALLIATTFTILLLLVIKVIPLFRSKALASVSGVDKATGTG